MNKLIKLELKRNNLVSSYITLIIITIIMSGFLYMITTISKVENDLAFQNYFNIFKMHTGISFIIFVVFSSVLLSKFIIEDYSGKKALLLFCYPVSRSKIFLSKLTLVTIFTNVGFLICTLIPDTIFLITESITPIISDSINISLIESQGIHLLSFILIINAINFISLRIGFINKSISLTIVSSIILSIILGNILMNLTITLLIFIGISIFFAISLVFAYSTNYEINKMEV